MKSNQIIQDIQNAIRHGNMPAAYLEELAAEYAEAVQAANQRLAQFISLLVEGYRDEALAIAEQTPELSNLVSQLDFPELQEWREMLGENVIGAPPKIQMETASALDQAYEDRLRLAPLMAAHRKLAIAQAPLRPRIDVLRHLQAADPINPIWPADLEIYEHARLEQIKRELPLAEQKRDLATIQELAEELLQKPWSIKLPKTLLQQAQQSENNQSRHAATQRLQALGDDLNSAWGQFDADRGLALAAEWQMTNQTAGLAAGDPIFDAAQDALAWAQEVARDQAEERQFRQKLFQLEQALDQQAPAEKFERIWYAVQACEREIPKPLQRRAQEYQQRWQGTQRRRRVLGVVVGVALILAAAGGLAWYLGQQRRQQELAQARELLSRWNGRENLEAAEGFLADAPAFVQRDPGVVEQAQRIREENRVEVARVDEFRRGVEAVQFTGPLDGGVENALRQLETLAKSPAEVAEAATLKTRLSSERLARQVQRHEKFQQQFDSLRTALEQLKSGATSESVQELAALRDRVQALESQHKDNVVDGLPSVAPSLLQQTTLLERSIAGKLELMQREIAAAQRIPELGRDLPRVEAFAQALTDFAGTYPTHQEAGNLRTAAGRIYQHQALLAWRTLAQRPTWRKLSQASVSQLTSLRDELQGLLAQNRFGGAEKANLSTELLLEQMLQQLPNTQFQTALDDFRQFFERVDFNNQHIAVSGQGDETRWLYLREAPRVDNDKPGVPPSVKLVAFRDMTKAETTTTYPELETVTYHGLAGQCVLKSRLDQLFAEPDRVVARDRLLFESLKIAAAEKPSAAGEPADPIVQAIILERVLKLAGEQGILTRDFANKWAKRLETFEVRTVDWIDYRGTREKLSPMREKLRQFLAGIRDELSGIEVPISAMEAAWNKTPEWLNQYDYELAGWIFMDRGRAKFYPLRENLEGSLLFGIHEGNQKRLNVQPVGRSQEGWIVDIPEAGRLYSGQLVYIATGSLEASGSE